MQAVQIDSVSKVLAQVQRPITHVAELNGTRVEFNVADYDEVVADLVAKHGPGVPDVMSIGAATRVIAPAAGNGVPMIKQFSDVIVTPTGSVAVQKLALAAPVIAVGQYDAAGDARSQKDRDAAVAAGFAPKQPVYRQGLRASGMRRHREEFGELPDAKHAATRLIVQVGAEQRRDVEFPATDVRVNKDGLLALGRAPRLLFTSRAFQSLTARLSMPAGASTYLPAIEPELRALNVNHWVADTYKEAEVARAKEAYDAKKTFEPTSLVFRTRNAPAKPGCDEARPARECFGIVSDSYGELDADKIAEAIRMAVPADARARVTYDGHRTKFDVIFFSNIEPEHAVAGEFFKAAVQIRTDDAGGGSIVVSAAIHQNLCLNFIILDKAVGEVARIRHIGSTEKLAKRFEEAFAKALDKISHFTKAWGYAQEEDALAGALVMAKNTGAISAAELDSYVVRPVSELLPGIFNGLIERELVPLPKRDRAATVQALMAMWSKDESAATRQRDTLLTRAAVVNAVTRYAHEVNEDPFLESEIEAAGGALLFGKNGLAPAPLPFQFLPA